MNKDRRHVFIVPYDEAKDRLAWCIDSFGPKSRKRWGHTRIIRPSYDKIIRFYFKNDEDAMAFKLRWL